MTAAASVGVNQPNVMPNRMIAGDRMGRKDSLKQSHICMGVIRSSLGYLFLTDRIWFSTISARAIINPGTTPPINSFPTETLAMPA